MIKFKKTGTKGFGHVELFIVIVAVMALVGTYALVKEYALQVPAKGGSVGGWTYINTVKVKKPVAVNLKLYACVASKPKANEEIIEGLAVMSSKINKKYTSSYEVFEGHLTNTKVNTYRGLSTTKWGVYKQPWSARVSVVYILTPKTNYNTYMWVAAGSKGPAKKLTGFGLKIASVKPCPGVAFTQTTSNHSSATQIYTSTTGTITTSSTSGTSTQ